jgi:methylglutaconyl-CoA hydratase
MPTSSLVTVERSSDVVQIALNRPDKRNALTRLMLEDLLTVLRSLPAATRLVVLSAQGPVFCAGMDLQEMAATAELPDRLDVWTADAKLYRDVLETLFLLPCPSLCVVQGPVLAGGVGLVLACDLVLGSESTSFALPEPKRGIVASIVLPLLRYRIGSGRAGYLLLSGVVANAGDAVSWGLMHRLVTADRLAEVNAELISSVKSGAPLAMQETKRQLLSGVTDQIRQEWDIAERQSAEARSLPEAQEGMQAFLEHRAPAWYEHIRTAGL